MKKLLIILILFILTIFVNAQDSTSYIKFKYDLMDIEMKPINNMRINFDNPTLKPVLILLTTFAINHIIIKYDEKHNNFEYTSRKTGTIYLIGVTACTLTFAFEMKKYNKKF